MLKKLQREMTKIFLPKRKGIPTCMKYLSYVVVGIVAYAVYDVLLKGVMQEGMENGSSIKELVFIKMNGCPACDSMQDEWNKFQQNHPENIKVTQTEREDVRAQELIDKHNVTGFPTILLLDENGNKVKDYDGERTAQAFKKFCKENI